MGFPDAVLGFYSFICYITAGVLIIMDVSYTWHYITPFVGKGVVLWVIPYALLIAILNNVLVFGLGALLTSESAWSQTLLGSKKHGSITDHFERNLAVFRFLLIFVGLMLVSIASYYIDFISTYSAIKNYWITFAIVSSSTVIFMLIKSLSVSNSGRSGRD